jgi:hypothetical protein
MLWSGLVQPIVLGERDDSALNGFAGGGFGGFLDLSNVTTDQQLAAIGQE